MLNDFNKEYNYNKFSVSKLFIKEKKANEQHYFT